MLNCLVYLVLAWAAGWGAFSRSPRQAPPLTSADDCKQVVMRAYEQLSRQATALARQPTPTVYRLLAETRFQVPGKTQERSASRVMTVALQQGNSYYEDGNSQVYSNARERVVVDHSNKAILLLDSQGGPTADERYRHSLELVRSQLLTAAQVIACTSQVLGGQTYRRVVFSLPAAVQARTHVATLTSLLNAQHGVYQTILTFTGAGAVRQVAFTVLPLTGAATAIRTVRPPLSYVYQPDHTVQPEFARYHITDQRKHTR